MTDDQEADELPDERDRSQWTTILQEHIKDEINGWSPDIRTSGRDDDMPPESVFGKIFKSSDKIGRYSFQAIPLSDSSFSLVSNLPLVMDATMHEDQPERIAPHKGIPLLTEFPTTIKRGTREEKTQTVREKK